MRDFLFRLKMIQVFYNGTISLMMTTMIMCGLVVLGHINNLYNTTFWALQQKGGMSATEAEKELKVIESTYPFLISVKKKPRFLFNFPRLQKRSWG